MTIAPDFSKFTNKTSTEVENGKSFTLSERDRNIFGTIRRYHVDGEVFPKNTKPERCDFMFEGITGEQITIVFYVELKNGKPEKAYTQLKNTVLDARFKQKHASASKRTAFAVTSAPKGKGNTQTLTARFQAETSAQGAKCNLIFKTGTKTIS